MTTAIVNPLLAPAPMTPMPLCVDAYQACHFQLIPGRMQDGQLSQFTFRRPLEFCGSSSDLRLISGGVARFVNRFMSRPITQYDIDEAEWFYEDFNAGGRPYPWPKAMFEKVLNEYGGRLPIVIMAIPDGQAHYVGEPTAQVWTDEPGMGELVGWVESTLLPNLFTTTVVATRGRMRFEKMMEVFRKAYPSRSENELRQWVELTCHDFGRRGAIDPITSGVACLYNFLGTDTMDAAWYATKVLNAGEKFGACSIPAAAHRTVTPWRTEREAVERAVELHKGEPFSFVADTYGYERCMRMLTEYAETVQNAGGLMVGRPDSGDPVKCIIQGMQIFAEGFGTQTQETGLLELNGARVIQGDGINDDMIFGQIYPALIEAGFSPINLAIGMGQANHMAFRSQVEAALKTSAVADGKGGYDPSMKSSEMKLKMSVPGPVAIDHSGARNGEFRNRVKPISMEDVMAGLTGEMRVYYDGRPKARRLPTWWEKFFMTRERVPVSWNELPPDPGYDTFDQRIRRMQKEIIARMTGGH